jgi:hypothetical protein
MVDTIDLFLLYLGVRTSEVTAEHVWLGHFLFLNEPARFCFNFIFETSLLGF